MFTYVRLHRLFYGIIMSYVRRDFIILLKVTPRPFKLHNIVIVYRKKNYLRVRTADMSQFIIRFVQNSNDVELAKYLVFT